jgi:hypothetical protein
VRQAGGQEETNPGEGGESLGPWIPSRSLTCECISPVGPAQTIEPLSASRDRYSFFHLFVFYYFF